MEAVRSWVTELSSPECAVPRHDPIGCAPQPCAVGQRRKSYITKYLPYISMRIPERSDSAVSARLTDETREMGSQPDDSTHLDIANGDDENNAARPDQSRHFERSVSNLPVRMTVLEPSNEYTSSKTSMRSLSKLALKLIPWTRVSDIPEQAVVSAEFTRPLPTDITVSAEVTQASGIDSESSGAIRSTDQEPPTPTVDGDTIPALHHEDLTDAASANQTSEELDSETTKVIVPLDSTDIYSPERGIYVGHLYQLPPPKILQSEWNPIRKRLVHDLRQATQALPASVKGSQRKFEPELYMSGHQCQGSANVELIPTIWIGCGSVQCQKAVQRAVADLSYTRRFPVRVTRRAPRPAGLKAARRLSNTPSSGTDAVEEHLGELHSGRDGVHRSASNTATNEAHVGIRVQSPYSTNNNSACGLQVRVKDTNGDYYVCKLGGLVRINDLVFGLTTAHAVRLSESNHRKAEDHENSYQYFFFDSYSGDDDEMAIETLGSTGSGEVTSLPARLWSARYGALGKSGSGRLSSSHSDEEEMHDFALLRIDFGPHQLPHNGYFDQSVSRNIEGYSDNLNGRPVYLVCSYQDIRWGHLLEGDRIIVDEAGCWNTRKIQLQEPLGCGHSGTWVVADNQAIGVIVAIYDDQPYAHMLPISSMFSGIQDSLTNNSRPARVHVLEAERVKKLNHARRLPIPTSRLSIESMPTSACPQTICIPHTEEKAELEAPTALWVDRVNGSRYPPGHFLMLCLVLFVVGLDTSAFPLILPDITNSFDSMHLIGWYGNVHLLAVSATLPVFLKVYHLSCFIGRGAGLFCLLLANLLIFVAGSLFCYLASSPSLVLVGRALCGISTTGILSGVCFMTADGLGPGNPPKRVNITVSFVFYALSRFVGPIIGAAFTDRIKTERRWKYLFLVNIGAIALLIVAVLVHFPKYIALGKDYASRHRAQVWRLSTRDSILLRFNILTTIFTTISVTLGMSLYWTERSNWGTSSIISLCLGPCVGGAALFLVSFAWLRKYTQLGKVRFYSSSSQAFATRTLSFSFLWGASYHTFIHYMPIWLRAVRNYSALRTGVVYLPTAASYLFGFVLSPLVLLVNTRYAHTLYPSQTFVSLALMSLSTWLISRFDIDTPINNLLGLQVLFGVGAGIGSYLTWNLSLQSSIEAYLKMDDASMVWPATLVFAETLGGSVGISVAQAVFMTTLSRGFKSTKSGLDVVLHRGITSFRKGLGDEDVDIAVAIFDKALTRTFYVSVVAAWLVVFLIPLIVIAFWKRFVSRMQKSPPAPRTPYSATVHGANLESQYAHELFSPAPVLGVFPAIVPAARPDHNKLARAVTQLRNTRSGPFELPAFTAELEGPQELGG